MFKKRSKSAKQNLRKKDSEDSDEETNVVVCEIRTNHAMKAQTTKRTADDGNERDAITGTMYQSERTVMPTKYAGDATHTSEIDTAPDRDARALLEKNIALNKDGTVNDKLYHGQAGYKNFIQKDAAQVGGNKHTGTQGPIRAPSFVRSSARFDYQPDICKDYKETGFCGYGDSCKFLHDRGDYKSGWQMEKEWDNNQAKKKRKMEESLKGFGDDDADTDSGAATMKEVRQGGDDDEGDESDDDKYAINLSDDEIDDGEGGPKTDTDGLPFACFICRDHFTNPVVTVCKHYFCSACAVEYAKRNKTKNCALCGKNTSGVFNHAAKLARKIAMATR